MISLEFFKISLKASGSQSAALLADAGIDIFTVILRSYSGWTAWPLAVSLCCKSLFSCWIFQQVSRLLDSSAAPLMPSADWAWRRSATRQSWFSVVAKTRELNGDIFYFEVHSSITVSITIFFFFVGQCYFSKLNNNNKLNDNCCHSWHFNVSIMLFI